jgi:hypothetical protein
MAERLACFGAVLRAIEQRHKPLQMRPQAAFPDAHRVLALGLSLVQAPCHGQEAQAATVSLVAVASPDSNQTPLKSKLGLA